MSTKRHSTHSFWRQLVRFARSYAVKRSGRSEGHSGEQGSAIILALILSFLLLALGLGITYSSLNNFVISEEFEKHQYALSLAEAGLNIVRFDLKGVDLDDASDQLIECPDFLGTPPPADGSYAARNPISLQEARTIDFENPPAVAGTRLVRGLLSPPSGEALNGGRYFARITRVTRNFSANLGPSVESVPSSIVLGNGWLFAGWLPPMFEGALGRFTPGLLALGSAVPGGGGEQTEGEAAEGEDEVTFYVIRVIGVYPIVPTNTGAGATRNAIAVIEAFVSRDSNFHLGSAVSILGPDTDATFSGNSFDIQGDELHPGISFLYDSPDANALNSMTSTYEALSGNQTDNVRGADGAYGSEPSMRDDTEAVSEDPSLMRILDPGFVEAFAAAVSKCADVRYTDPSTHLSGSNVELGTSEDPKVVYVEGDLILTGSGSGAGLLVVRGDFDYRGAFDFNGLVLVVGSGSVAMSGANKNLVGGMLIAHTVENGGGFEFSDATFDLRGNSNILYDGDMVAMALNQLPLNSMSWREITPEIEPSE